MNFVHPEMLYLIPVAVAAVIWFSVSGGRLRRSRLRLLLGQAAEDPDAVLLSPRKRRFRHVLLALTLTALLLAAARPYWNSEPRPTGDSGRDILILFDVSKSMLSTDLPPSRLEHAKFLLRQLVSADPEDSFGLVAFAGTAYLSCPLTSDRVAFEEYIKELSPAVVPIGGTNLELALRKAMDAFKAASGNNRAIVLFTDGDELTGSSGKVIAELKKREIPLFVVGLGDPAAGAPVLDEKGEARRDKDGHLISTRLNESALKKLALETGGVYVRASVADSSLGLIEKRIADLSRASDGLKRERTIPVERFPLPLIAAGLFLAGFLLLGERSGTRRKFPILTVLFALFLLGAADPAAPVPNPGAASAPVPAPSEANGAEALPSAAPKEVPIEGTPEMRYNKARELQLAGDPRAEKTYESLLNDSAVPPEIQSRALFNLGTGALQSARKSYQQAEALVKQQQLDPALKALDQAKQALTVGEDLNMRAISIPEAGSYLEDFGANLEQLTLDRNRIEELRRKIEELKKQQQEAQKRTEEARQKQDQQQQQKQDQNQQNQQQNQQSKQGQQQQNQQNQQQKQGQGQQSKPNSVDDALEKARQAAEKLQNQAEQLGQKQLSGKAEEAKRELEQAKQDPRPAPRKEHIRKAQEALGTPKPPEQKSGDGKESGKENSKQKEQQKSGEEQKKAQPSQQSPQPEAPAPKPGENGAEQLLRMAEGEESQFREGIRREQYRRPPVEKDW